MVLAVSDSRAIGCGFARLDTAKPYLRHREEAYLGLMFVDPFCRGRGVNQQILDHLVQWCRRKGVLELRLDVYSGNQSARRAYEKAGFSASMVEMRMRLPDDPT
jgi:GNAT superfamily N-acetyltransferase